MLLYEDARNLFRHISDAQFSKLPHRLVCPRLCLELGHDSTRDGHAHVYDARDLRRVSSTERVVLAAEEIPSYTRKHFKLHSLTAEADLLDIMKCLRIEAQIELGKRYGLFVDRSQLPFPDETDLFEHMAQQFQCK